MGRSGWPKRISKAENQLSALPTELFGDRNLVRSLPVCSSAGNFNFIFTYFLLGVGGFGERISRAFSDFLRKVWRFNAPRGIMLGKKF